MQWRPLAFAWVRVYYANGTSLGAGYTDINGNRTIGPVDVPQQGIYLRCEASTNNTNVIVYKYDTYDIWLFATSNFYVGPDQNGFSCNFSDPEDALTVFSYHTGLNKGWCYIYNITGTGIQYAAAHYRSAYGPDYDQATREMDFPGYVSDYTDTILHEYAHYVMHQLYNWWWPPNATGDYNLTGIENPNMAWTEGWAYFFPLAVKNNGIYVGYGGTIDFENKHWCSSGWDDGENVTGRVAGAFLDIFDSNDDGYDVLRDGFNRVWNTTSYVCSIEYSGFRFFWLAWNSTYYNHPKNSSSPYNLEDWNHTLRAIFQNSIDYRGPGDVNVDGIVDIEDIYYAAIRFGVEKGQPTWDYLADLNHDDIIDIADVYIASLNQGKTYDC